MPWKSWESRKTSAALLRARVSLLLTIGSAGLLCWLAGSVLRGWGGMGRCTTAGPIPVMGMLFAALPLAACRMPSISSMATTVWLARLPC